MTKGKKGGDQEQPAGPGQGQGGQTGGGQEGKGQGPTPAPPQATPHATPPPKPLPVEQNPQVKQHHQSDSKKQGTAKGEATGDGKSNPREEAIKKMALESKKVLAASTKSKNDDLFTPDKQIKFYSPGGDDVEKNVDKPGTQEGDTNVDTDNPDSLHMDTGESADENAQNKGLKRKAGPPSGQTTNDVVLTVLESKR